MIIEDKKIILLHPGKTAGTSVESLFYDTSSHIFNPKFFFGYKNGIWTQHATIKFMRENIPDFESYEKVLFIRNPYERLLSVYNFGTSCGKLKEFFNACGTYRPRIESFEDFVTKLPKFFEYEPILDGCHLSPQHLYYEPECMIIRFENLQEDFKQFKNKYGISQDLPHQMACQKKSHDLSDKSIQIINEIYDKDFNIFNYSKINDNSKNTRRTREPNVSMGLWHKIVKRIRSFF